MPEIPTIEPFQFIRSTAFSERVQLANKLNEVIDAVNSIGDLPDLESQITEINTKISELEKSIGSTDTSLAELENQVNGLISEVNTTIKQAISALESDVEEIDTRLTTAEGTISEHGTEIDGLLKEVVDGVEMTSNPHGTIRVQINHEDGTNDISAPIDLGLVEQGGIVLQSGTTDRSFKLIVALTDGTSWQTNDFVIPEGGGTDVSVTNISIAQGTESNMIQVKIGLSDGSTISSNDWTVVTPSEFSALGTRVATAEGKITAQDGEISDLDSRVQALEDSSGYTLQPATATRLGGVKIGANVTVQADGTISVDLSTLDSRISEVETGVTALDSDVSTLETAKPSGSVSGNSLTIVGINGKSSDAIPLPESGGGTTYIAIANNMLSGNGEKIINAMKSLNVGDSILCPYLYAKGGEAYLRLHRVSFQYLGKTIENSVTVYNFSASGLANKGSGGPDYFINLCSASVSEGNNTLTIYGIGPSSESGSVTSQYNFLVNGTSGTLSVPSDELNLIYIPDYLDWNSL